jgi:hypothetical protein
VPTPAFGVNPIDEGIEPRPQIRAPEDRMSEDIHALRERYVQPQLFLPSTFNLTAAAPGNFAKVDFSQMKVNSVLVSVISGTVNLWFGDYTANLTSPPHAQFVALGAPSQIMIPVGPYTFTIASTGGAAVVTFVPMAL